MSLDPSIITCANLRLFASWIRDDLDVLVARDGPESLRADDLLRLNELFTRLQDASVTAPMLRSSRIHRAVIEIAGKATRWPGRLADECDKLVEMWTAKFGILGAIRPDLFGQNGRLEGWGCGWEMSNRVIRLCSFR